ncbi:MAG: hypothetical protein PHY26_00815 [Bacilli bacterium]|jgi:hypothetical protein|nr:hypothetical protein [Bacilli bacterium]
MNFNALQKYVLKIYAIVIIIFTFFVPTIKEGRTTFDLILVFSSNCEVNYFYLLLIYLGITLATVALLLSFKDLEKRKK